jgi:hypothetical protein
MNYGGRSEGKPWRGKTGLAVTGNQARAILATANVSGSGKGRKWCAALPWHKGRFLDHHSPVRGIEGGLRRERLPASTNPLRQAGSRTILRTIDRARSSE